MKKILVIINPNSGKGNSKDIYYNIIKNKIKKKNYIDNEIITKYPNQLEIIIKYYDFSNINKILLVGGDGIIHEFLQGILNRNDESYKIPLGIIPTGSGNGIATNLNINNIIKSIDIFNDEKLIVPINIHKVNYNNTYDFSFLYHTWTMISDIDIDTEFLRYFGEYRYYWGILKFILKNKNVKGILKYNDSSNIINEIIGDFSLFCAGSLPWISSDFKIIPDADPSDNYIYIIYIVDYNLSLCERMQLFINCLNGTHIKNCDYINLIKVKEFTLEEIDNNNSSYFVCDGEKINTKKINVQNTNLKINFYK
jgi:sphingosine kinase